MASSAAFQELIVLFDATASRVERELHIDEFDELLAGEWIIEERSASTVRCAYVQVGPALAVQGVVLFQLKIDGLGYADPTFNVPLEYMALQAGPGPDLGSGSIRMACRSQCPVPWHTINLWEPAGRDAPSAEAHSVMEIQRVVWRNRLALKVLPAVPLAVSEPAARTRHPQQAVQELGEALRRQSVQRQALEEQLRALDELENRQAQQQKQAMEQMERLEQIQAYQQTEVAGQRLMAGVAGAARISLGGASRPVVEAVRHRDSAGRPATPGKAEPSTGRIAPAEPELAGHPGEPFRAEMQRQQQGYLEQISACRDEIQKLKAALRYEQERNRRLQQLLRGDL